MSRVLRRFCWLSLAVICTASVSDVPVPTPVPSVASSSAPQVVPVLTSRQNSGASKLKPEGDLLPSAAALRSAAVVTSQGRFSSDRPSVPTLRSSLVTEATTWDGALESPLNQSIPDWGEPPFGQSLESGLPLPATSSTPRSVVAKSRLSLLARMKQKGESEPLTRRNVTTQVGQTVYLRCLVDGFESSSAPEQVSWIRLRDFHLLTVKLFTYTSDNRFTPVHLQHSRDWALQIKYPEKNDEGYYECQVNGSPITSHYVFLKVLEPKTRILGAPDIFVEAGSALNLTCVIDYSPEPPVFVFWYHGDRMINYDPSKGEISIRKSSGDSAISRLYLQDAQVQDSGNYTCCPSNAGAASINVHVLRGQSGEKQAAVQNDVRELSNFSPLVPAQTAPRLLLFLASLVAVSAATLR